MQNSIPAEEQLAVTLSLPAVLHERIRAYRAELNPNRCLTFWTDRAELRALPGNGNPLCEPGIWDSHEGLGIRTR